MEQDKRETETCCHGQVVEQMGEMMPSDECLYDVAELFKLFGDSTRMKILYALFESELCVCHMAQQLRLLKAGRLVQPRREGKTVYYSLADDHVRKIIAQGMEHIME